MTALNSLGSSEPGATATGEEIISRQRIGNITSIEMNLLNIAHIKTDHLCDPPAKPADTRAKRLTTRLTYQEIVRFEVIRLLTGIAHEVY
jgi:hypothetical protein